MTVRSRPRGRGGVLGVDLGSRADHTAYALVVPDNGERRRWAVPLVERLPLGAPYPVIADDVAHVAAAAVQRYGSVVVAADATGVGDLVMDLIARALSPVARRSLVRVVITGGKRVGGTRARPTVPKVDLIAAA